MGDSSDSRWSKYRILVGVITFHVALISVLLDASRYQAIPPSPTDFIDLLILPPSTPPKSHPLSVLLAVPERHLPPLPSDALTVVVPLPASPTNDTAKRDVDWGDEAHRTAETATNDESAFATATSQDPMASSRSAWFPAPQHHAGEQFKLDTGEWVVWINNYCYQISEWAPRPSGWPGSALPSTVCPQQSQTPRGDLFQDLRQ